MTMVADYDFNTDLDLDEVHLTAVANFHGKAHPGSYYDPPEARDIEMAFFTDEGKHLDLDEAMAEYKVTQTQIDQLEECFRDMDAEQEAAFYEDAYEDEE